MDNREQRVFNPYLWGIIAFCLGIFFSLLAAQKTRDENAIAIAAHAKAEVNHLADSIVRQMAIYQYGLRGTRAHILAQGGAQTNRAAFRHYIESRDITTEFPGAGGMGFIRKVPAADQAEFIANLQAAGQSHFSIWPLNPRNETRYVVEYIEPASENSGAVGFDIASNEVLRAAADAAARTGQVQLTAPVTPSLATAQSTATFFIFMPVFRSWATPSAELSRVNTLFGWAYAPLVLNDTLADLPFAKDHLRLHLADVTEPTEAIPFYASTPDANETVDTAFQQQALRPVHGRMWMLTLDVTAQFIHDQHLPKPTAVLFWGTILSILVGVLTAAIGGYWSNRRQLIDQQALLATVVVNASDAIIVTDTEDTVISWNKGAETTFGFSAHETLGKRLPELITPAHLRKEDEEITKRLLDGDTIANLETLRVRQDGATTGIAMNCFPLRDERGIITRFSIVMHDITEYQTARRSAMELNRSLEQQVHQRTIEQDQINQMLHSVLTTATEVAIVATDLHGIITIFNTGAERMFGYSAEEMVGQQTPAKLHRADEVIARGEELTAEYGEPIEGFRVFVHKPELEGAETRQWTYVHKDGHELNVSLALSAIYSSNGELQGYLGVALDATQHKLSQEKLMGAKNQLSIAADIAELGVWSYDTERKTLVWNDRMFAMYDQPLSLRESGLSYEHWAERIHPDDAQDAQQMLQQTIAGNQSFKGTFRLLLPSQEVRFIQAAAVCEKNSNGKVTSMIGINRDITNQQLFENHLRNAKQKADEASAAKSNFLANMSHEIRTPMNAVLGMLALVQKTHLTPRQHDYILKAESSAKSLLGLLNDILDLSKMESGKLLLAPHPFELEDLMSDLGVLLAANHGDNDVEVLFQLDANIPRQLVSDRLRLQQVLTNLASNALKFTASGHVIVAVTCLEQTSAYARLRFGVRDTGIGISEEQQARIFNSFEQAESSTTRRFGGTGLGLVISKRLVNLMGGELHLKSQIGAGSEFWFDIELAIADPTPYAQSTPGSLAGIRVLVVDDNSLVSNLLQQALSALGADASQANSGAAAIEAVNQAYAASTPFDAVLMDWRMPEMDGVTAARSISANRYRDHSPVIIMVTAYESEVYTDQTGQAAPYDELLTKPVTPHQVAKAILQHSGGNPPTLAASGANAEPETPLQGLRLLVVEDNALNRQIAQELFEASGAQVELAIDGMSGVSKVVNGESVYDVVLMDIQMPDIDGYEATRRIRAHGGFADLPIVAMTANVSADDKHACLAAGMNGHLGKPIDMEKVVSEILHLLKREVADPATKHAPASAQGPIDDAQTILRRFGNKQDLFARMLKSFRPEILRLLDDLTRHYEARDAIGVTGVLHSIKGVASTMGAKLLAQTAADLEAQCKKGGSAFPELVTPKTRAQLQHLFDMSEPLLQQIAQQHPAPPSPPPATPTVPTAHIRQQLIEILPLLKADNMSAIDRIETLCEQAPGDPQLTLISELTNALDFVQAINRINQLLEEIDE